MELGTLLDASHLLTFLAGTTAGAAGKYYADKFTDQRKRQEARAEGKKSFGKLRESMPALLAEVRTDLLHEPEKHVREFVMLPNRHVIFNSDGRPRYAYFETEHPGLRNKLQTLADAGHVVIERDDTVMIGRFTEAFAERLLSEA
jgi:hypothetical protein